MTARKLFILRNATNAKAATNAELRYTAGTPLRSAQHPRASPHVRLDNRASKEQNEPEFPAGDGRAGEAKVPGALRIIAWVNRAIGCSPSLATDGRYYRAGRRGAAFLFGISVAGNRMDCWGGVNLPAHRHRGEHAFHQAAVSFSNVSAGAVTARPCLPIRARPALYSEAELHAVLELKRIEGIAGRAKSQIGIRRQAEIDGSVKGIEVLDVGAIEQVEEVGAAFGT